MGQILKFPTPSKPEPLFPHDGEITVSVGDAEGHFRVTFDGVGEATLSANQLLALAADASAKAKKFLQERGARALLDAISVEREDPGKIAKFPPKDRGRAASPIPA